MTEALDVQMCGRYADLVEAHDYQPVHTAISVGFDLISAKNGEITHYLCSVNGKSWVGWCPRLQPSGCLTLTAHDYERYKAIRMRWCVHVWYGAVHTHRQPTRTPHRNKADFSCHCRTVCVCSLLMDNEPR